MSKRRRSSKYGSSRPVEEITDEDLENVAITVKDKIYDKVLVSICFLAQVWLNHVKEI